MLKELLEKHTAYEDAEEAIKYLKQHKCEYLEEIDKLITKIDYCSKKIELYQKTISDEYALRSFSYITKEFDAGESLNGDRIEIFYHEDQKEMVGAVDEVNPDQPE